VDGRWVRICFGLGSGETKEHKSCLSAHEETSMRACLLGQVGTDVNEVVGDHSESEPASRAVRSYIGAAAQPHAGV
jgi:hypothetical protein